MIGGIIKLLLTAVNGTVQQDNFMQLADGSIAPLFGRMPFALDGTAAVACSPTPGTAVEIIPADPTRKVLHIFNRTIDAETVDIGCDSSVTEGGGIPIYAQGSFTFDGQGAVGPFYAVSPTANTPLSYAEG